MKVRRYDELLRARGYKCLDRADYQGRDVYEKRHLHNVVICIVDKDSHGKAQEMNFRIHNTLENFPTDFAEFKSIEFDREYLWREANKIHECFETLKQMKSPKHIYF